MVIHTVLVRNCPLACLLLYYFYLLIQVAPGALARALPTPADVPLASSTNGPAHHPPAAPSIALKDSMSQSERIHRFKCIMGAPVGGTVELGCSMLGREYPLQKRTLGILGSGSSLKEIDLEHEQKAPSWGADVYPCSFESGSGSGKIKCEPTGSLQAELSGDPRLRVLVGALMDGLPISLGPELTVAPNYGSDTHRYISIFPQGDEYHMLLVDSPYRVWPSKQLVTNPKPYPNEVCPSPQADKFPSPLRDSPLTRRERDPNPSPRRPLPTRGTNRREATALPRGPPGPPLMKGLRGAYVQSTHVRCWFQIDQLNLTLELNCDMDEIELWSLSEFIDSNSDSDTSDSDSDENSPGDAGEKDTDQDSNNSGTQRIHSETPGIVEAAGAEEPNNRRSYKRKPTPETHVDRWFLCLTGSRSKILCEIPDWYSGDDHPQSGYVRKASMQVSDAGADPVPDSHVPLHFFVNSQPVWHRCKFNFDPTSNGMRCRAQKIASDGAKTRKSRESILQSYHRPRSTRLHHKRDELISNQPSQNITSPTPVRQVKPPAFGRMGNTFAFIGFFTVLAVFTIAFAWLTKHILLAIYDALEDWTDSRRRKRKMATTVAVPPVALVGEHPSTVVLNTGSQALEGASDSVKRKKAGMRTVVGEDVES